MKKDSIAVGVVYVLVGIVFLVLALFTETRLDGVFFGLAGAGIVPGILRIFHFLYWSSPKHSKEYEEKLEKQMIEQKDEMMTRIRDRSGYLAHTSGALIISFSMLIFCILGGLGIIENYQVMVYYLGGFLAVQMMIYFTLYHHFLKKIS